jgi:hypothetical protein
VGFIVGQPPRRLRERSPSRKLADVDLQLKRRLKERQPLPIGTGAQHTNCGSRPHGDPLRLTAWQAGVRVYTDLPKTTVISVVAERVDDPPVRKPAKVVQPHFGLVGHNRCAVRPLEVGGFDRRLEIFSGCARHGNIS